MRCSPANTKNKDMAKFDAKKADLNKDGQLSDYEKNRGKATAEAMQMSKGYKMAMGKDKSGIDSTHSFPMKQAHTIRMSPLLQTENEDGVVDVQSYKVQFPETGVSGTETVSTTTETVPGQTTTRKKTWDDLRAEGFTEEQIKEAKNWRKANPDVKNVGVTETTPDQTVETQKVEQTVDTKDVTPLSNYGERQNMRRAGTNVRLTGKYQRKSDRFENRADKFLERKGGVIDKEGKVTGLSKKDQAKYERLMKKSEGFQNVATIGSQRADVFSAQAAQGGAGTQQTKVDQVLTPGQRERLTIAMPPPMRMQMKFKGKKSTYKK
jgi:hypothetical protein